MNEQKTIDIYFFAWANNYTKQNNYTLCYK